LADPDCFARFKSSLYKREWVVYAKRPFGGAAQLYAYLGRYTHRVAISNRRLLSLDSHGVRFVTRGEGTCTLAPEEFIRRFLLHVLPKRFVKIRHYGLLASGSHARPKAERARQLLAAKVEVPPDSPGTPAAEPVGLAWQDLFLALTGIDLSQCPQCHGRMVRYPILGPFFTRGARPPPCVVERSTTP
jgi:hypothetical protein